MYPFQNRFYKVACFILTFANHKFCCYSVEMISYGERHINLLLLLPTPR